MAGQNKKRIVAVIAVLLMALAVFLTVMLFVDDSESGDKSDTKDTSKIVATEETSTEIDEYTTTAPAKYLWEYGPDNENFEKPSEMK